MRNENRVVPTGWLKTCQRGFDTAMNLLPVIIPDLFEATDTTELARRLVSYIYSIFALIPRKTIAGCINGGGHCQEALQQITANVGTKTQTRDLIDLALIRCGKKGDEGVPLIRLWCHTGDIAESPRV